MSPFHQEYRFKSRISSQSVPQTGANASSSTWQLMLAIEVPLQNHFEFWPPLHFFGFLCLSDFDILSCSCSGGISKIKEALQEILNSWKEALNGARCSFEEILLSLYLTLFHNKLPLMSPHVLCKTKWI